MKSRDDSVSGRRLRISSVGVVIEPAMSDDMLLPAGHLIRPLQQADLPAVHAIECACQTRPWTIGQFAAERDNPVAAIDIYQWEAAVAGFLCSWLIAGELQIQNLATAPEFRRQGVARRLLKHVLERSARSGMEQAWLEVRSSNQSAIALYREFGFQPAGQRPAYYHDGEDALIMKAARREGRESI